MYFNAGYYATVIDFERVFVLCAGRFGRGAFIVFEVCANLVVQKNDEIPSKSFM